MSASGRELPLALHTSNDRFRLAAVGGVGLPGSSDLPIPDTGPRARRATAVRRKQTWIPGFRSYLSPCPPVDGSARSDLRSPHAYKHGYASI